MSPLHARQQGFSLVELLIATAIGITMIAAATITMFSNYETFRAADSSARMQENARFALAILADNIRMAGFFDPTTDDTPAFMFGDDDVDNSRTCGTFNPCTADGGGTTSDRLAVWFNPPDDAEVDCTGAATDANDLIANVFYLETIDGNVRRLMCRGYNVTDGNWIAAGQPLVDGIDNLQLQYGILADDNVVSYVPAGDVDDWAAIRSVRVSLLVSDGVPNGSADIASRTYAMLDAGNITIEDDHNRQLFTTTVLINNAF